MKAILIAEILLTMVQAETVTCERDGRDTFTCETESDYPSRRERREEQRAREEYRQDMQFLMESAAFSAETAAHEAWMRETE